MADDTPAPIPVEADVPPEREPVNVKDYDRLELFRHAVLQRSRLTNYCTDQALLNELDERSTKVDLLDDEIDMHGLLRTAVGVLLGFEAGTRTQDICDELSRYKAEQDAFRESYIKLRAAASKLLTYPPNSGTPSLIDGLKEATLERSVPLDDVDDANSLQRINSELEDEVNFIKDRLVHAIRAVQHMTSLALDVACERQDGSGCQHG